MPEVSVSDPLGLKINDRVVQILRADPPVVRWLPANVRTSAKTIGAIHMRMLAFGLSA